MWPILACSIVSIAVFAERLFYFHRATIHVGEFLKGLSNIIRRRNFAEALHESAGTPGPAARVIHAAIIRHDAPRAELRDIVQEAAQLEAPLAPLPQAAVMRRSLSFRAASIRVY